VSETRVKDLKAGDRVELDGGGVTTITRVARNGLIEVADDVAYDVAYRNDDGVESEMTLHGKCWVVTQ